MSNIKKRKSNNVNVSVSYVKSDNNKYSEFKKMFLDKNILAVENSTSLNSYYKNLFPNCLSCNSHNDALFFLKKNKYDLVILEEHNEFFLKNIREHSLNSKVQVVLITSHIFAIRDNLTMYNYSLFKPVKPIDLYKKLINLF